jgi:hypothetical protein
MPRTGNTARPNSLDARLGRTAPVEIDSTQARASAGIRTEELWALSPLRDNSGISPDSPDHNTRYCGFAEVDAQDI